MHLFLIIFATTCILGTIILAIANMEYVYNLSDKVLIILITLLIITTFSFVIIHSYQELIIGNTSCTTHNHPISEQVSNKDCKATKGFQSKDNYINENNIQANCGDSICNQCGAIIKHESNPVDNASKEQSQKDAEVHKEENIHKEIINSEIPTKEEEYTSIDEQLICNIPNCIHCTNNSK